MTTITSKNFDGQLCTLVRVATGQPFAAGDIAELRDGVQVRVIGGRAPHKPESSGKAWVVSAELPLADALKCDFPREYYASVVGGEWRV